jgi:hypothetical protein
METTKRQSNNGAGDNMDAIIWDTTDADDGTHMVDITDMSDDDLDALLEMDDDDIDPVTCTAAELDEVIASMTVAPSAYWIDMVTRERTANDAARNAAAYHKDCDGADFEEKILAAQEVY